MAGDHLPRLRLVLDDVSRVSDQELRARDLAPGALMMLVAHRIAKGNADLGHALMPYVEPLRVLEAQAEFGSTTLKSLLAYICDVGETDEEGLTPLLEQLGPVAKEIAVTTAERLRAEGEARGEARGEIKGRVKVLIALLTTKFGAVPPHLVDRIRGGDAEMLETWVLRVLTADSLDEVFRTA